MEIFIGSPQDVRVFTEKLIERWNLEKLSATKVFKDDFRQIIRELACNCDCHGKSTWIKLIFKIEHDYLFITLLSDCIQINHKEIKNILDCIRSGMKCDFFEREHGLGMRFAYSLSEEMRLLTNGFFFKFQLNKEKENEKKLPQAIVL